MKNLPHYRVSYRLVSRYRKIKEKYEGIAMLKDGKIERVFPDYNSVVNNGYSRSQVSACCNNKAYSHAGFEWKLIKNLNNGEQSS